MSATPGPAPIELSLVNFRRAELWASESTDEVKVSFAAIDAIGRQVGVVDDVPTSRPTPEGLYVGFARPEKSFTPPGGQAVPRIIVPSWAHLWLRMAGGVVAVHGLRRMDIETGAGRAELPIDVSGPGDQTLEKRRHHTFPDGQIVARDIGPPWDSPHLIVRSEAERVTVSDVTGLADVQNTGNVSAYWVGGHCRLSSEHGEVRAEYVHGGAVLNNGPATPEKLTRFLQSLKGALVSEPSGSLHLHAGGTDEAPRITVHGVKREVIAASLLGGPIDTSDITGRVATFRTDQPDPLAASRCNDVLRRSSTGRAVAAARQRPWPRRPRRAANRLPTPTTHDGRRPPSPIADSTAGDRPSCCWPEGC